MGFWGTFVLARSTELLPNTEAVLGYGYQHENVYELGDRWQLLETRGMLLPLDLDQASEQFVAATATAALAVRVDNSDCLTAHARTPDGWTSSFHLPGAAAECPHRHVRPQAPRTAGVIAADLAQWARSSGLTPAPEQVRTLIGQVAERRFADAAHKVPLALLPTLGLAESGAPHRCIIDVEEPPYCAIVGFLGIARQAWDRRAERENEQPGSGSFGPEQPWEAAAIRFEAELWAARFRPGSDTEALRQRAEELCAAYQAVEDRTLPTWRT